MGEAISSDAAGSKIVSWLLEDTGVEYVFLLHGVQIDFGGYQNNIDGSKVFYFFHDANTIKKLCYL
jgi:hypothetical protein